MTGIVLSLCDRTGNMVKPWLAAGYRCVCVDLRPMDLNDGVERVAADVLEYIPPRSDYVAAFAAPPCDDLSAAGAKHFKRKGLAAIAAALKLVDRCRQILEWTGAPWLLENPIGTLSTYWRKPDFTFNPCDYGAYLNPPADAYTKRTCLWTGGGFVMPEHRAVQPVGQRAGQPNEWYSRVGGKSQRTKDYRSATPMGFAIAVFEANQPRRIAA